VDTYLHDLDVTTFLTHTWSNDLNVTLTSPAGTVVTLTTRNAPNAAIANVYNGTLWDDDADPGNVVPYVTPFANSKLATDTVYANNVVETVLTPEEPLGAFIGEDPNGTWTVTIYDAFDFDGGSLNEWKLDVTTLDAPVALAPAVTFNSSAPVAIPSSGVVSSTINVSGAPTYLQKLTLQTFITHTWSDDLDITLTSPAGTVVTLTTDNGSSLDNVFNGTVWDDDADPGNPLPYTIPFAASKLVVDTTYTNLVVKPLLAPEEPLAAFIGEDPNGAWTITISDDTGGDSGNLASWKLNIQAPADNVPPTVTVEQAGGQADPTNLSPITYTVVFNEPVTGFTAADVDFTGSTVGGTLVASVTGSGTTYTVEVTGMTGEGNVVVSLPAGAAQDGAGNPSEASTSTDNVVLFDTVGSTVTINQAAGQPDPVAVGPILFDVVFAEPVTGFDGSDISFAGSTVGGSLQAVVSGSGTTYQVSVTGMTGVGTVVASVVADAAADPLGNLSFASTSTDNSVTVDTVGQVQFDSAVYTATETGGTITITVTRTGGTANAVTVDYTTSGGTATAGLDYQTAAGSLSWANGEVGAKTFVITLFDDILVEGDETVNLVLSNPTNGLLLGTPATAILTIEDLEEGLLQFTTTGVPASEDGGLITVSVSRTEGSVGIVTVDFATSDETARDGLDYTAKSGTLTWGDGETGTKTFEIAILPDAANEGKENILLTLSNATNGSRIGLAESRITIAPSDPKPAGTFTDADGDIGTVRITGGGTLGYYLTDPDGDGKGPVELIELSDTDPLKSVLTLTSKKKPTTVDGGRVALGGVTGTGLKTLSARTYNLDGDGIDLTGPLGTVVIGHVQNGADIKAGGLPTQKTRITAGIIGDGTDVALGSTLVNLTATKFGDGSITVPSIGVLAMRGDKKAAVTGDLGADLTVNGDGVAAGKPAVATLRIAGQVVAGTDIDVTGVVGTVIAGAFDGSLTAGGLTTMSVKGNMDGDLTLTGTGVAVGRPALSILTVSGQVLDGADISAPSIGTISVKGLMHGDVTVSGVGVAAGKPALKTLRVTGAISGSDILVNGNVSLVQASSFQDSRLFAGYTGPDDGSGTFNQLATVTTFNLTGPNGAYDNSTAIAAYFKTVTLASIQPDNGKVDFGFLAGETIGSLRVKAPQPFAYVPSDLSIQGMQDFKVRIV
jgi:subtilisin-like proprotein convertase family protein